MKQINKIVFIFSVVILSGCSSVMLIESWKPFEIEQITPEKVLILGVSENLSARVIFEENLKKELESHRLQAVEGTAIHNVAFMDSKRSNNVKETKVTGASEEGFKAVDKTRGKGMVKKTNFSLEQKTVEYNKESFGRYYYRFQKIDYGSGSYNIYEIYIVEIGIFIINGEDVESLFWIGGFKIVNPLEMRNSFHYYVEAKQK